MLEQLVKIELHNWFDEGTVPIAKINVRHKLASVLVVAALKSATAERFRKRTMSNKSFHSSLRQAELCFRQS